MQNNRLSLDEMGELDELLASMDEKYQSMDASEADGFMTAVQLLPNKIPTRQWLSPILSTVDLTPKFQDPQKEKRLVSLLRKRFEEIGETLKNSELIDPIIFDVEDDLGNVIEGKESLRALEPFALGFLEANQRWEGLLESENPKISESLIGILRHLPQESLGDLEKSKEILDKEVPLDNLPEALSDLASCVAQIAKATHGYEMPELDENRDFQKTN